MTSDPNKFRTLDGLRRHRLHLLRHSSVSYVKSDGKVVDKPDEVPLTEDGIERAIATGKKLANIDFDQIVVSGLRRTVETAELVAAQNNQKSQPETQVMPGLREVIPAPPPANISNDERVQRAYNLFDSIGPGAAYGGLEGENFLSAQLRASSCIEQVIRKPGSNQSLVVAHGIINRLVIAWALNIPVNCMAPFEQDFCCVNMIDFVLDEEGHVIRTILRGHNITAFDPWKETRTLTTIEEVYEKLLTIFNRS